MFTRSNFLLNSATSSFNAEIFPSTSSGHEMALSTALGSLGIGIMFFENHEVPERPNSNSFADIKNQVYHRLRDTALLPCKLRRDNAGGGFAYEAWGRVFGPASGQESQ